MSDAPAEKDDLDADLGWLHVFHSMISTGTLAKMTPSGLAVYIVVKYHINIAKDPDEFPTIDVIARDSGVGERTVVEKLKHLEKMGYLQKNRTQGGRPNTYTLTEHVPIMKNGEPYAKADFSHLPFEWQKPVDELKALLKSGSLKGQHIHLHITFNQFNDQSQQNNSEGGVQVNMSGLLADIENVKDPALAEAMRKMIENRTTKPGACG